MSRQAQIIAAYNANAVQLAKQYDGLSSETLYHPIRSFFPPPTISGVQTKVIDIGAGAGRDAQWLYEQGYDVTAVEPAKGMRSEARQLPNTDCVRWIDDRLPTLSRVLALNETFDLVLMNAVWAHLSNAERAQSMPLLFRLIVCGGRLIVSVRHGPASPDRPTYPAPDEETSALAKEAGFANLVEKTTPSVQPDNIAAGVTWTFFCFEKE